MSMPTRPSSPTEALKNANSKDIRRCWICQQDDIDDTPENSLWKRPCPCSFTAHDTCLLEWISNEEAPKPGEIARDRRIKCPQCKVEINIQRPRDYIVESVEIIQRASRNLVYPAAAVSVLTCTYAGLLVYGINVVRVVFGSREAQRVLYSRETFMGLIWPLTRIISSMSEPFDPLAPAMKLASLSKVFLGAPLIAPSLILLRSRWADKAFSLMLPWYFLHPANHHISWPPSPGLVFATIPYIRTAYNEIYRLIFSDLETKWDMAVQRRPRAGETQEQVAMEVAREEEEEAFFEVQVALPGGGNINEQGPDEEIPVMPPIFGPVRIQTFSPPLNPFHDTLDLNPADIESDLERFAIMDNDDYYGGYDDYDDYEDYEDDEDDDENGVDNNNIGEADDVDQHPIELPALRLDLVEAPTHNPRDGNLGHQNIPGLENNELFFHDIESSESDDEMPRINVHNARVPHQGHRHHQNADAANDQRAVVHHFSADSLTSLMMGALAFPFIAATAGDILKHTLPSSLITSTVTYSWGNKIVKKGILTEKWGRTVIGGCLFVFIKDALTLYCKWKNAKIFGKRIVMDYAGERKIN